MIMKQKLLMERKRAPKPRGMCRVQGNELHHKEEGHVLRLVPVTDMKHHDWNTLCKKEAVAACACSQKASKAVWARTIMLRIANEFRVSTLLRKNQKKS